MQDPFVNPPQPAPRCHQLGELPATPRLDALRQALLDAPHELCTQKAELISEYFRARQPLRPGRQLLERVHYRAYARSLAEQVRGGAVAPWKARFSDRLMSLYCRIEALSPMQLVVEYAKALAHTTERMEVRVYEHELIVGNLSSRRIGAPIHPEFGGLLLLGELEALPNRAVNPIQVRPEQIRALHDDVFPFWFRRSVLALTPLYSENPRLSQLLTEARAFVLTQFSGISHVTPDYPTILRLGFVGIERRILDRQRELERQVTGQPRARATPEQRQRQAFYQAALISVRAAIAYGARWRAHLLELAASEGEASRRQELRELAEIFALVPARPARTFHQALQSVFTAHVLLHQENFQHGISYGRMDQYLLPYYQRDLAAGRITPQRAVELLGCFLAKSAEQLPLFVERATRYFSGLSSASGITLGGRKLDGTDACNELSSLFLVAYDRVRLRQPNLHVRVHQGSSAAFTRLCCEVLKKGGGMPAFFNDEEIVGALVLDGAARKHALDYAVVGCTEWGVPYRSFPAAGAGFVNLPYALLLALNDGRMDGAQLGPRSGAPTLLGDMKALLEAFRQQLRHQLALATEGNNAIETVHAKHRPAPLLSSMVGGCIAAGREVNAGGATYNATGFQGVGLADVVDSLVAIHLLVFVQERCDLTQLMRAVKSDFAGDEALRGAILHRLPKYGQGGALTERYAHLVSGLFAEELRAFENARGGGYVAGFWSMTTHQEFGRRLGALPSGRLAGQPLANGISPQQGSQRLGPTAALSDAARVARAGNGYAVNQWLPPALVRGESGNGVVEGLVRAFFAQGGMQLQFNVVGVETLLDARRNPEKHRDLVVRVSGYSAYFNDLTDEMKDEIIARTAC